MVAKGYETVQIILHVILCDVADTSTTSGVHIGTHCGNSVVFSSSSIIWREIYARFYNH